MKCDKRFLFKILTSFFCGRHFKLKKRLPFFECPFHASTATPSSLLYRPELSPLCAPSIFVASSSILLYCPWLPPPKKKRRKNRVRHLGIYITSAPSILYCHWLFPMRFPHLLSLAVDLVRPLVFLPPVLSLAAPPPPGTICIYSLEAADGGLQH